MKEEKFFGNDEDLEKAAYGNTKRLTKKPLLFGAAFIAFVIIAIIFGVNSNKSSSIKTNEAEDLTQASDSRNSRSFVNELSQGKEGIISEKQLSSPLKQLENHENQVVIEDTSQKVEEKPVALQIPATNIPMQASNQHSEEELASFELQRKILTQKRQAFEMALVAKTTVELKQASVYNSSTLTGNNLADEKRRVDKELYATRQRIDAANSGNFGGTQVISGMSTTNHDNSFPMGGVNQQYDALNDGVSGNGAGEGYSKFNRGGNWNLQAIQEAPNNPFLIRAGMVIPATLISGINSDLAGQIIGQVSQSVYDSATGRYLLIPQGTRLIGAYQTGDIKYGQERVMIAWQRLEFPDGKVLDLGSMPGTDVGGYAGFSDEVDEHWWKLISSAFLMSGITASVVVATDSNSDSNSDNNDTSVSDELKSAMATQFGNVIAKVIERNLNIAPTLKIRPGYRFNVMVTKDMNFAKPFELFDYKR